MKIITGPRYELYHRVRTDSISGA